MEVTGMEAIVKEYDAKIDTKKELHLEDLPMSITM